MIIILMILLSVAFLVLLERNLLGSVQLRTSPLNVGYWGILQTVIDSLNLLNNPSAINNMYSFTFLVIILLIGFTSSYYMIMVIMLALILLLLNSIMLSSNIYANIGSYRLIVLAWSYDIVLLVILLLVPNILMMLGVMYFVFSCEVSRTPIDLIEGESELVSSFNTEFSGSEFVSFFLGEYLGIIILLIMIVSSEIYIFLLFYGVVIWVRGSYPRKNYTEIVISMWNYVVLFVMIMYLV